MANKLQLTIDLAADKAISALTKLKGATKNVNTELDDTRSIGKKVAAELDAATDRIIDDFKATERAAEAMGAALGPEMAQSIGRAKIDSYISDLKRLGLTADDVEADAEALAASLRKSADAADQIQKVDSSYRDLGAQIKNTGAEADNTRSVVANFAGNAAQEIPGVTDAFGPLNMAIGQFAEYGSEGNIQMKNFAAAGAGLGVAALAMWNIQDRMAKIAKIDAFKKDRVKAYEDAIADADSEVLAIKEHLEQAGKVEFLWGDSNGGLWTGGVAGVTDVTKKIAEFGLTVDTTAKLIADGPDAIEAWGRSMVEAGNNAEEVGLVVGALTAEAEAFDTAAENAKVTNEFLGKSMDKTGDSAKGMSKDVRDDRDALVDAERATRDLKAANDALLGTLDQQDAWDRYAEALWKANDGIDTSERETRDLIRAQVDLINSMDDIPDEQKVALITQLEQGDVDTVNAWLTQWAKGVNVPVRFKGQGDVGFMKQASGGVSPGGVTLVGENGPELVNMPRGAQVFPAAQTAGMLGGGGGITVVVNAPVGANLTEAGRQVADALRQFYQAGGQRVS